MVISLSVRFILSIQYFLYFGVLGIMLPYFNLYCYNLGLTGFQIGLISSVRSLSMAFFPLVWGSIADRFQKRNLIYVICQVINALLCIFYLPFRTFEKIFLLTCVLSIFYAPIISFLEAFTVDLLGQDKNNYGKIRVWGSISFIFTVIAASKAIELAGIDIAISMIVTISLIQAFCSFYVPSVERKLIKPSWEHFRELLNSKVIIFLISAFLMSVSHGTFYVFSSIHLQQLGMGTKFIGIFWALGPVSEIFVMINSKRLLKRFSMEHMLLFSFVIASIRWSVLYFTTSPIIILATQLTHSVTYGIFHISSILYIDSLTPKNAKTVGQALNNAISYGLGFTVGFALNGYLFEAFGTFTAFLISAFISMLGGILFLMGRWKL